MICETLIAVFPLTLLSQYGPLLLPLYLIWAHDLVFHGFTKHITEFQLAPYEC